MFPWPPPGSPDSCALDAREETRASMALTCTGREKAGRKVKYERMRKAGLDWGEERQARMCANR